MPVFRLIVRIDFETCFELMDRPGEIAKTIFEGVGDKKFFAQMLEGPMHEVRAHFNEAAITRDLRVAPNYMIVDYRNTEGIPLGGVREDHGFSKLMLVITKLRQRFKIDAEARTGLRFFYVSTLAQKRDQVLKAFSQLIDARIADIVTADLEGAPSDFGIQFDGGKNGEMQYHFRAGPCLGLIEVEKYFDGVKPTGPLGVFESADFICDIDQYQVMTKFGADLMWWKHPLHCAEKLIPRLEKRISDLLGTSAQ